MTAWWRRRRRRLLREHSDRPLDGAGADAAVGFGIAAEHDAVGLGPIEALGLVGGALEGSDAAEVFFGAEHGCRLLADLMEEGLHLFLGGSLLPQLAPF